jgi:hypothetical protein
VAAAERLRISMAAATKAALKVEAAVKVVAVPPKVESVMDVAKLAAEEAERSGVSVSNVGL